MAKSKHFRKDVIMARVIFGIIVIALIVYTVLTQRMAKYKVEKREYELLQKKIQLDEAIKNFGVYKVNIKLHPKVTGVLTVKVQEMK